jgi:hypothetical protein
MTEQRTYQIGTRVTYAVWAALTEEAAKQQRTIAGLLNHQLTQFYVAQPHQEAQ